MSVSNNFTGLTTNSTLTTGASGAIVMSGLSSGINSSAIIQAQLAAQFASMNTLQAEISGLGTANKAIASIKSALQLVNLDAQMLGAPSTFFNKQAMTSSNTAMLTAQSSGGIGAPIGSYSIGVTQLAAAAQTTFNYTAPTAAETLSFSDGVNPAQTLSVAANTTVSALAQQINASTSLNVYAAVSASGQLVLSSRATGSQYTVSASDTTTPANLQTVSTTVGKDALYTIGATSGSSHSNTVTGAIAGVQLNLLGVTGSTPVTLTVNAPAPDATAITKSVQQFVTDYNTAMTAIQSAISTQPSINPRSYDPNSGSLFNDPALETLVRQMRSQMLAPGSGLPTGMATMVDLGVTTGSSTGTVSRDSVDGNLSLDATKLANALTSNPSGAQQVIQQWSQGLTAILTAAAGPGGSLAGRLQGNASLSSSLQSEYSRMQANFTQQQQTMEAAWASVEAIMSQLKSQGSYMARISAKY